MNYGGVFRGILEKKKPAEFFNEFRGFFGRASRGICGVVTTGEFWGESQEEFLKVYLQGSLQKFLKEFLEGSQKKFMEELL